MGVIGGIDKCKWESEEERAERIRREEKELEEKIKFEKMTEEEKRELREQRKNELLTSDAPELDEIGYINICFEAVALDYFPPSVDVKCTRRRALLLIEGFIKPEEFPEYIEALKEEGYALDKNGIAYIDEEYFRNLVQRRKDDKTNHGNEEKQVVTPKDIAEKTKDLPEEKISSLRSWFSNLIEKVFGKGR